MRPGQPSEDRNIISRRSDRSFRYTYPFILSTAQCLTALDRTIQVGDGSTLPGAFASQPRETRILIESPRTGARRLPTLLGIEAGCDS
jgi:hypothetical protein